MRLLLAEDERSLSRALTAILEGNRYSVDAVFDGAEALAYLEAGHYDAAILAAGTCGFGMGATPNAMANMQALTDRFVPSVKAYILVPIVGSMFADFINSITITFFINML